MRKIFGKIHLWLGIPLGLIISLVCISGAILVFDNELSRMFNPGRYYVAEVTGEPIPVETLVPMVSAQLDGQEITSVNIPSDPKRTYSMGVSGGFRSAAYVNQYTGELIEVHSRSDSFMFTMMRLHRWLLDGSRTVGKQVVGYSVLLMVLIILSGLVIWWPKNRAQMKANLKIKTSATKARFWRDLHVSGGFYMALALLVLALTGLTWSFPWYRQGFFKVFGVEMTQSPHGGGNRGAQGQSPQGGRGENEGRGSGGGDNSVQRGERPEGREGRSENGGRQTGGDSHNKGERGSDRTEKSRERESHGQRGEDGSGRPSRAEGGEGRGTGERRGENLHAETITQEQSMQLEQAGLNTLHWDNVLSKLKAENPDFNTITLQEGQASVKQNITLGNSRATDKFKFDAATGKITERSLYKDQDRSAKIGGWIYSIHVGSWGGWFSKMLTFIVALVGGILPLTGYYLFYKKHRRQRKK